MALTKNSFENFAKIVDSLKEMSLQERKIARRNLNTIFISSFKSGF